MKAARRAALAVLLLLLASGCMYPGSDSTGSTVNGQYIQVVEQAITAYQQRTGYYPIHNSTVETPEYEKYRIDFKKLLEYKLISQAPTDSFEAGGYFYYVITNIESNPRVRLMDLRISQHTADMQRVIDQYRDSNGEFPFGDSIHPQFYAIDFELLNRKPEQVKSVFSGSFLSFILHESGKVAIDYGLDLMQAISRSSTVEFAADYDLRELLIDQSPFIPVSSYPYYWQDGEPIVVGP